MCPAPSRFRGPRQTAIFEPAEMQLRVTRAMTSPAAVRGCPPRRWPLTAAQPPCSQSNRRAEGHVFPGRSMRPRRTRRRRKRHTSHCTNFVIFLPLCRTKLGEPAHILLVGPYLRAARALRRFLCRPSCLGVYLGICFCFANCIANCIANC